MCTGKEAPLAVVVLNPVIIGKKIVYGIVAQEQRRSEIYWPVGLKSDDPIGSQAAKVLSEEFGIPFVALGSQEANIECIDLLSRVASERGYFFQKFDCKTKELREYK